MVYLDSLVFSHSLLFSSIKNDYHNNIDLFVTLSNYSNSDLDRPNTKGKFTPSKNVNTMKELKEEFEEWMINDTKCDYISSFNLKTKKNEFEKTSDNFFSNDSPKYDIFSRNDHTNKTLESFSNIVKKNPNDWSNLKISLKKPYIFSIKDCMSDKEKSLRINIDDRLDKKECDYASKVLDILDLDYEQKNNRLIYDYEINVNDFIDKLTKLKNFVYYYKLSINANSSNIFLNASSEEFKTRIVAHEDNYSDFINVVDSFYSDKDWKYVFNKKWKFDCRIVFDPLDTNNNKKQSIVSNWL